jgi:hypothetical protein
MTQMSSKRALIYKVTQMCLFKNLRLLPENLTYQGCPPSVFNQYEMIPIEFYLQIYLYSDCIISTTVFAGAFYATFLVNIFI